MPCSGSEKPFTRLYLPKVLINPAQGEQLVVATLLHDHSVLHHHDPIGVAHRAQPMGNHHSCAILRDEF
jgi:hypothetical protein